jgi:endonuclease/exonuclease/phosphatase family metal-dependent hydrolase
MGQPCEFQVAMASSPDFLCIQEVERSAGAGQRTRKWSWQHGDDQVAELGTQTGLSHTLWAPALHNIRYDASVADEEILLRDDTAGDYGVAILSAWPLEGSRLLAFTAPTPASSEDVIYMDREQQPRGACAALVRPLYDSTFSRTVWRLYGGAKGLAMWY